MKKAGRAARDLVEKNDIKLLCLTRNDIIRT
jgi:hypothetical protein